MDRRAFLAAATAATLPSAVAAGQLTMNGGTPVRLKPLASANWRTLYYDDKEQAQLTEVLQVRKPFRFANSLE